MSETYSPTLAERVAKLEAEMKSFEGAVNGLQESIKGLTHAVDGLREIAMMGRGMWWLTLKVGGLVAFAVAVLAGGLTALEKLGWRP